MLTHLSVHTHAECIDYHQQVVEQEDFSLVDAAPLSSVRIRNLEQLTAAHQPAMRQGQHLQHTHTPLVFKMSPFCPSTKTQQLCNVFFRIV